MDKSDHISGTNGFPGSIPMVRIDGSRVRGLRESKGLTQLYLSTVVGVTTDTISRWENRRYPTIKLENAKKLAQALEVELDAILEQDKEDSHSKASAIEMPGNARFSIPARSRHFFKFLIALAAAAGLAVFFRWHHITGQQPVPVSAERILPSHVPPGQPFPVLIRVRTGKALPVSLILKEVMPSACRFMDSEPPCATFNVGSNTLKWISRVEDQSVDFVYMVQTPLDAAQGSQLTFTGSMTLKQAGQRREDIRGATTVTVAPFHWADTDQDGTIDDEEILTVYDRYSDKPGLKFNRDLIDDIWAGHGYDWNGKTGQYVVRP